MLAQDISLPSAFQLSALPSKAADLAECWSFEAVEARMIEAMRFAWRDEPGTYPFAKDGPWDLMRRDTYYWNHESETGKLADAPPPPRVPLSRAERARMEEAVGWLGFVSGTAQDGARKVGRPRLGGGCDARLIVLVTRKLAAHRGDGEVRVPWTRLLRPMGLKRGAGTLSRRYERAVAAIVRRLDADGVVVNLARG